MLGRRFGVYAAACALFVSLAIGTSEKSAASEASDRLVALGLANLKSGQFVVAAKYFNGARQVDSKDARALFYLGVALNRLGQHGAALESFDRMLKLNLTHRELGLEAGWAAIARGRTALAVRLLEPYVKQNPNHAKAREFLGRAYLGNGRLDDAERELNAALKLDPKLRETTTYYLGNVAAARGDKEGAAQALADLAAGDRGSAVSQSLRSQLRQAEEAERRGSGTKPWSVYGAFSAGHNNNVIALSDQIVQPSDITSIKSNYFLYEMGGRYFWDYGAGRSFLVGGGLSHQRFNNIDGQNATNYNVNARYTMPVVDGYVIRLDASGAITNVDNDVSVRTGTLRPSLVFAPFGLFETEIFGRYADSNYRQPSAGSDPAFLNRDSISRDFGFNLTHGISMIQTTITGGFTRSENDAVGGDFDYYANRLNFGSTTSLPYEITASANYSVSHLRYKNLNSQAPTTPPGATGFGFKRRDRLTSYGIRLSRPFWGPATVFLQWQHTSQFSNLAVFDYSQDDYRLGLSATF